MVWAIFVNDGLSSGSESQHLSISEYLGNVKTPMMNEHAFYLHYIVSEQAKFSGFSSLLPFLRKVGRSLAFRPEYGTFPAVNISQQVTPNDHWRRG